MAWTWLLLASVFEIGWTIGLKASQGFSRPSIASLTVLLMVLSLVCLGMAMRQLPLGTAYAIWTGCGILGAVIGGILWFDESLSPLRIACIVLIMAGVVGLKFSTH